MKNRNSEVLNDFVNYCIANPELRFWQALLNWSGQPFILISKHGPFELEKAIGAPSGLVDPYNWETKDGR